MNLPSRPAVFAIGLLSGIVSAFFGVGGGIIAVPALTLLFQIPLKQAIGTSLVMILPTALAGVITEFFVQPQNLNLPVAAVLAAGAVGGTFLGKSLFEGLAERSLRWVYAVFLLLVALRLSGMFHFLLSPPFSWSDDLEIAVFLCLAIGALAGLSSTLFGIGGGVVAVPLLVFLLRGMFFHSARATALLMILPAAALGIWHHRRMGTIETKLALQLAVPACLGSIGGVFLVQGISGDSLRSVFAILLALAAWRLLREGLKRGKDSQSGVG